MAKKWKINCPGLAHRDYRKLLLALELSGSRVSGIWLHCNDPACRRWFRVAIGQRGGVTVTQMPPKYHLDLEQLPVLVDDHE